ncbi:MAG TPA: ATP-binding protein [Candidatus Acidoferrales bacterium]|jgi:serine/threonine-protein kinase RsbW|nr:ATP-binding protein [Candidatus Acidoferrales bacterium]
MNLTRVSYTLDSTLESVNKAEQAASDLGRKVGLSEDEVGGLSMAVREAAVNAVLHGNRYDASKRMTLAMEASAELITISVRDEGSGFNAQSIPDPLAPENLLKQSGRGIFLIHTFMDEVHFRDLSPGTEITMTKHLRKGENKEDAR